MESMFIDYMMKVMRQTVPKNEMDLRGRRQKSIAACSIASMPRKPLTQAGWASPSKFIAYLQERNAAAPVAHSPSQSYTKDQTTAPQGRVAATTTIRRSP